MSIDKIYVAKLGKTVGLKGDIKIFLDSDFPNQFKTGATFTTNKNLTLKVISYNKSRQIIKFENFEDIELAKKLTNQELFTTRGKTKENCQLEKNEHFWFDIMDCIIYENGKKLGKVIDINRYPVNDYLEIQTDESLVKEDLPKVFLLPYILETYILNVNIKDKIIDVQDAYDILENS